MSQLDPTGLENASDEVAVETSVSQDEDKLAELFMGDAQGQLLYLKGSDNDTLRSGNDAFDEVLDRFDAHPMATYVRMIKGVNAGRAFKTIDPTHGKLVTVRPPKADESIALLATVTDAQVLDPVTTGEVVANLACVQSAIGDDKAAQATLARTPAKRSRK